MVFVRRPASVMLALVLAIGAGGVASAPASAAVPPGTPIPHRIKSNGVTFFDTVSRLEFLPRGANYVRLAGPPNTPWHSTFEPGLYDRNSADAMLGFLKDSSGYNVVRVFVDAGGTTVGHGIGANPSGPAGFRQAYFDNLADFIGLAAAHRIYVMLSLDGVPHNAFYLDWVSRGNGGRRYDDATGHNRDYLDAGWVVAKQAYVQNLVDWLGARLGAHRTTIFAYATDNEVFFRTNEKPFSQGSGTYVLRGTGGVGYDMASAGRRQKLLEDGLKHYADAAAFAVSQEDPDALVTVGFGTNYAVGKAGHFGLPVRCDPEVPGQCDTSKPLHHYWYPGDAANLAEWSDRIHFVDVHVYPQGGGYSLAADLGSSGIQNIRRRPYMLGELGAPKAAYPNINAAADDMRSKQIQSCSIGRGAKGWLFWTYDTGIVQPGMGFQGLFYTLLEPNNLGAINGALAPVRRLHPCA